MESDVILAEAVATTGPELPTAPLLPEPLP